ncbi:MAG: ATP-binding cassette domain-containing protein, partial [Flavobacteriales bacterium]|nr:ATP-binding cassette domain-containing protein [Flavobacteriales bacterium]
MAEVVLHVEDMSKQYRLGEFGTGTLQHDLNRWWHKVRGKDDPYLKIGEKNDRSTVGGEYVWALKDINFEVTQGEVLGVIGKNGAGKSTLLKILSQITGPTTGRITANGRIASLLEVGTGMHHELTGRENIYLNGAILGMTRAEVARKFDDIVDFSGCARYVDTPVKRYSSGMMVRLGFAVAAFLEPEILIVDEVLAVGDAEFQQACIGKMKDVSKGGRTVLFVSHNMASIKALCHRGLLMDQGMIDFDGGVKECVDRYLDMSLKVEEDGSVPESASTINTGVVKVKKLKLFDPENRQTQTIPFGAPIKFEFEIDSQEEFSDLIFDVRICNTDGIQLVHAMNQ